MEPPTAAAAAATDAPGRRAPRPRRAVSRLVLASPARASLPNRTVRMPSVLPPVAQRRIWRLPSNEPSRLFLLRGCHHGICRVSISNYLYLFFCIALGTIGTNAANLSILTIATQKIIRKSQKSKIAQQYNKPHRAAPWDLELTESFLALQGIKQASPMKWGLVTCNKAKQRSKPHPPSLLTE